MRARFRVLLPLAVVAGLMAFPALARAATVVGQTQTGNVSCGANATLFNTTTGGGSNLYVVPAGNWTVTSWSVGDSGGGSGTHQMALVVVRPTGTAGQYTVVGASPVETIPSDSNVSTFSASFAVQGGDIIGIWATANAPCGAFNSSASDIYFASSAPPASGDTLTGPNSGANARINIAAALTPPVQSEAGNSFAFCYSHFETDPVMMTIGRFEYLTTALQPELGFKPYWTTGFLASAVLQADGSYKLLCNTSPTAPAATQWIGNELTTQAATVQAAAAADYNGPTIYDAAGNVEIPNYYPVVSG